MTADEQPAPIDYGCRAADPDTTEPGLFFCAAHLSYGYRGEPCHAMHHGSVTIGWPRRVAVRISGEYVYIGA